MSQLRYNILEHLNKQDNHIRGLAKVLGTNQMSVARTVKKLSDNNILDLRKEGRNSVYRLKDSLEAQEELFILEHQKLVEILTVYPRLRPIVKKIKEHSGITCAVLFGSYAKKIPKNESDIDIYIETKNHKLDEELQLLDSKVSIKTGTFNKDSTLGKEIINNHIIIKGVERYHELIR